MFQKKYILFVVLTVLVFCFERNLRKKKKQKEIEKDKKDAPPEYKGPNALPLGAIHYKTKKSNKQIKKKIDSTIKRKNEEVPNHVYESYFTCFGDKIENKICRFKNLFYDPEKDVYFIIFNEKIVSIDPASKTDYFVNASSLDNHTVFKWDFIEVLPEIFQKMYLSKEIVLFSEQTYIFSRFHGGNIMHIIHDDFLPQFAIRKQFSSDQVNLKNNIIFINDGGRKGEYDQLFFSITNRVEYKAEWKGKKNTLLLFKDAVIGQSKSTTWYQYGFGKPQGPIPNKTIDGFLIREAADCIKKHYRIVSPFKDGIKDIVEGIYKEEQSEQMAKAFVSIISRKQNRLILNENELKTELAKRYKMKVVFVRLEECSLEKMIEIMNRTVIAIGMHGSLLIASIFMPPGSIVVELYPFAVPSANYTPYKHLCNIPGMEISYRSWENKYKAQNISYPNRNMHKGGIRHLPKPEQRLIEKTETIPPHPCCTNPYWLFRIYQDTFVNISEVASLIKNASKESLNRICLKRTTRPGIIEKASCSVETKNGVAKIIIQWKKPWNVNKQNNYEVWSHQSFQAFPATETKAVYMPRKKNIWYDFWVRCVGDEEGLNKTKGPYTEKISCCVADKSSVLFKGLEENQIHQYVVLKGMFPLFGQQRRILERLEDKIEK